MECPLRRALGSWRDAMCTMATKDPVQPFDSERFEELLLNQNDVQGAADLLTGSAPDEAAPVIVMLLEQAALEACQQGKSREEAGPWFVAKLELSGNPCCGKMVELFFAAFDIFVAKLDTVRCMAIAAKLLKEGHSMESALVAFTGACGEHPRFDTLLVTFPEIFTRVRVQLRRGGDSVTEANDRVRVQLGDSADSVTEANDHECSTITEVLD